MSLITFRVPGTGRRQAGVKPRLAAENERLRHQLEGAGLLAKGLRVQLDDADEQHRTEVAWITQELNEERTAHQVTRDQLATAVRANTCNAGATTVQTNVSALRAAMADQFVEAPAPGPEYAPYRRVSSPVIRVVPLWDSPQSAHPAAINLVGAA